MLLPALRKAKEAAHERVCANNLKQMGLGLEMYCSDFDGYTPTFYDGKYTWESHIGYYSTAAPETFNCPSNKNDIWDRYRNYVDRDVPQNYMLNHYAVTDDSGNRYKKSQIRKPSYKIFLIDGRNYQGAWNDYLNRWFPEHNGRSNILFIDGHVKSMRTSAIPRAGTERLTYWQALYD
jgi:prepilin-type processing-associated H-X9-DG protein